jgi:hypothetical protein
VRKQENKNKPKWKVKEQARRLRWLRTRREEEFLMQGLLQVLTRKKSQFPLWGHGMRLGSSHHEGHRQQEREGSCRCGLRV